MSDVETAFVRGSGGAIFEMDIPAEGTHQRERFDQRLANGDLALVAHAKWVDRPDGSKHLVEDEPPKSRGKAKAEADAPDSEE